MAKRTDWQAARAVLEQRRRAVIDEIRGYPGPITACDAQFNHLTEERRRLNELLVALDAAARDPQATLADFLGAHSLGAEMDAALTRDVT